MSWSVGDVVPLGDGLGPLFVPGAPRWVALIVRLQREDAAEAWLQRRGVYGFHPVIERRVVVRGAARVVRRRYLPGFVFARFPGVPVLHRVFGGPFVVGGLRDASGALGVLDPASIRGLHAMRAVDVALDEARAEAARKARAAARVRAGDSALFRAGPFAGQPCEVVSVGGDGGVVVRLRLFTGEVPAVVAPDDLVPVRRAVG